MGVILLLLLLGTVVWFRSAGGERFRPVVASALRGALGAGAVGFALGFVGPVLVTPEANQGPLLGIFITGPLGFLLGLVWGIWRGYARR